MPRRNPNVKEIFSHGKSVMVGDAAYIPLPTVLDFPVNAIVLEINSGTEIENYYSCMTNCISFY